MTGGRSGIVILGIILKLIWDTFMGIWDKLSDWLYYYKEIKYANPSTTVI